MPQATLQSDQELGLTAPPPGLPEVEPETRAVKLAKIDHATYRKLLTLDEEKKTKIRKVMKNVVQEWKRNTKLQNDKLLRGIDRFEGITGPKEFPWPDASNLNIPYTEIQILTAYDIVCATTMESDPMYFIRELLPNRDNVPQEKVDPKVEQWINFVMKKQLRLDEEQRMAVLLAFRDPLSLLCLDWTEETPKEFRVEVFEDAEALKARFPDASNAGVPPDVYNSWLGTLGIKHEPIALEIEERVVRYRGPKARVVELKDFVRVPVACPDLRYTLFHGDQFRQRRGWFRHQVNLENFYKEETEKMLTSNAKDNAIDSIAQQLDTIEGISSSRQDPDEYDCVRGNLQIDLNDDGEEELYHVVYNPDHDKLLRVERYPYWHNRPNYIPHRIRRKPNRLLGRCFMDMLFDINEEINTQHNQRIDSRTITTVPSFLVNQAETDLLANMDRKSQSFFPGCRFPVSNMNNMKQLETKVDFSGTLQEEQNLFMIGEMLTGTGASSARANSSKDPRASGKKKQIEIGQSNQRIDGYIRELRPSFIETASQVMELFYQFAPGKVLEYSYYDEKSKRWATNEIKRTSLRNRNMTIELARSSVLDNPDAVLQRALTDYQLWKDEPLVGGVLKRRWELIRQTMFAERKSNIPELLPNFDDIVNEMQQQDQQLGQGSPGQQAMLEGAHQVLGKAKREGPDGKRQGSPDMSPQKLDRSKKG